MGLGYEGAFWTSGRRRDGRTDFYWKGRNQEFTFTNWDQGQPDGGDCVEIRQNEHWYDYSCDYKEYFICEK